MKSIKTLALIVALALPCSAFATGIPVFDASRMLQTLALTVKQATQISKEVQQLQNQAQMLRSIGSTNMGDLNALLGKMRRAMNQANSIVQESSRVQDKYKALFPDDYSNKSFQQLENRRDKWMQHSRNVQKDARRIQATVAHSQQGTAASVRDSLSASQAAPGPTAATQATNQLLATVSAQLSQMQSLLIAQHQVMQDMLATRQAKSQRADAMLHNARTRTGRYTGATGSHDFTPNAY